jgi:hypothetical protein
MLDGEGAAAFVSTAVIACWANGALSKAFLFEQRMGKCLWIINIAFVLTANII